MVAHKQNYNLRMHIQYPSHYQRTDSIHNDFV